MFSRLEIWWQTKLVDLMRESMHGVVPEMRVSTLAKWQRKWRREKRGRGREWKGKGKGKWGRSQWVWDWGKSSTRWSLRQRGRGETKWSTGNMSAMQKEAERRINNPPIQHIWTQIAGGQSYACISGFVMWIEMQKMREFDSVYFSRKYIFRDIFAKKRRKM